MNKTGTGRALAALAAVGLLAAACSSSKSSSTSASASASGSSSSAAASQATATTAAASGAVDLDKEALAFVGGKGGAADPSATPITIGYVNQQGGALDFSDATAGVQAGVNYVNNQLGGIDGHPIKLVTCWVQTEEDGQKCGTQMLNNSDVKFIITGLLVFGGQSLYTVINGQKPIMIFDPVTQADYNAKNGFAFSGGVAAGYLAIGQFLAKNLTPTPKSVAILTTSNPAGVAAINGLVTPTLNKAGITDVRIAKIADGATGPDVVSAVQAANTSTADAILVSLQTAGCIQAYDAFQSLNISGKPVVTTGQCYGKPVAQALGGKFPEWIYADLGFNPFMAPSASVPLSWNMALNLREVLKLPNSSNIDPSSNATYTFGPVLTLTKVLDQVGFANLTPDAISAAMKAYHGPLLGTSGSADCGKNPAFPTVCGSAVGFQAYKSGAWVSIADGYTGTSINAW